MAQRGPSGTPYDESFISEEALTSLANERKVFNTTYETQASSILREATPEAAMQVVNLMRHSARENIRLAAAKYVLDKMITENTKIEDDELTKFLKAVQG